MGLVVDLERVAGMKLIERKFHKEMLEIYMRMKREAFYNSPELLDQLRAKGGVLAAKDIIAGTQTYGFDFLKERRRLDISVESLVLNPEYDELFEDAERVVCRERLKEYGYSGPQSSNKWGNKYV